MKSINQLTIIAAIIFFTAATVPVFGDDDHDGSKSRRSESGLERCVHTMEVDDDVVGTSPGQAIGWDQDDVPRPSRHPLEGLMHELDRARTFRDMGHDTGDAAFYVRGTLVQRDPCFARPSRP